MGAPDTSAKVRKQTANKGQAQYQAIFKLQGFSATRTDDGGLENGSSPDKISNFRPRKSHTKSRNGCGQCKARRVKCDENREGGCMKCRNHGIECNYLRYQPALSKNLFRLQPRNDTTHLDWPALPPSMPRSELQETANDHDEKRKHALVILPSPGTTLLKPTLELCPNVRADMTSPLASLHHFEAFTAHTCGSPLGQSILSSCIIPLAGQASYLMHAMLGIAAAHMAYLLPVEVNAVQHARNKLADAWHWGQALVLFRKELGGDESGAGAGRSNMDALLGTIMLVAIHQFMLPQEEERSFSIIDGERRKSSFVLVEDADARWAAMKWLTIQSGFKLLLNQLERFLGESVWLPVFLDADPEQPLGTPIGIDEDRETHADEVEKLLCQFCKITNDSTPENNVYYSTLETIICVRRLRPMRAELFNKLITLVGRISPGMKKLLWMRDTAALLILYHFLSLMSELKQWWITARAESECHAIMMYLLNQKRDAEGTDRIRKVLAEPAKVMGFVF